MDTVTGGGGTWVIGDPLSRLQSRLPGKHKAEFWRDGFSWPLRHAARQIVRSSRKLGNDRSKARFLRLSATAANLSLKLTI